MRRTLLVVPLTVPLGVAVAALPWRGVAAQTYPPSANPPLQDMSPQQQDSLLPPSLRLLAPRPPSGVSVAPPQSSGEPPAPDAESVPPPDMTPQVPWPNKWQPASAARMQVLDKVNAQVGNLTVKVGQAATFESLTITVKACVVRPPDQPADAAAFLEVTDNHPDAPGFAGWMLANEPSVSMMESPIYDIRVIGCS